MLTRLFASPEEASAAIHASPLAGRHDEILALLRPTVFYHAHTATTPVGATRMGGTPDMPPSTAWPVRPAYPDADSRERLFPSAAGGIGADFMAAQARRDIARMGFWPSAGRPVPPAVMQDALAQQDAWCLLAEIDAGSFASGDPRAEYFMGLWLYFWIERADLSARRFDRIRVIGRR